MNLVDRFLKLLSTMFDLSMKYSQYKEKKMATKLENFGEWLKNDGRKLYYHLMNIEKIFEGEHIESGEISFIGAAPSLSGKFVFLFDEIDNIEKVLQDLLFPFKLEKIVKKWEEFTKNIVTIVAIGKVMRETVVELDRSFLLPLITRFGEEKVPIICEILTDEIYRVVIRQKEEIDEQKEITPKYIEKKLHRTLFETPGYVIYIFYNRSKERLKETFSKKEVREVEACIGEYKKFIDSIGALWFLCRMLEGTTKSARKLLKEITDETLYSR